MITNFFIPELNNHDVQEQWFQQDGATCHTARATIDLLKDTFGDRLISRFGPVNWPPRSCDLTPLDYFLWGYVKSLVYADKPQTLDHLEDNIRRVIADIRPQMLEKVIENWTSRLDYIRASVAKEFFQGCLLYDFKVGLSAAALSCPICQASGDSVVNECTTRHWFQKFRWGELFLCDKARTGRPQALDDESLLAAIEEDSSQTCVELARQFNTSSETVRLHLNRLGKTYRLSKWDPHTLLEVHKQQRVAACLSLLSRHHSASIFNRVLTSDKKWVLYDTPKRSKH
ncbi:histone-lysine N-methyltransferase SETMAR [Trichonephila clavipes]|uniref:Histone-lysine N-methyltransferase SETMAR n=1 Tax=Trichonephila clavipes TaxID=2585209 RepID=A0A8X6RSC3_TRICX|nr:histone-lysine N-methyltransferase SETMAR [Trichonephila clavipes]